MKTYLYIILILVCSGCGGGSFFGFGKSKNQEAPKAVTGGSVNLKSHPDGVIEFSLTQPENPNDQSVFDLTIDGKRFKGNISGAEMNKELEAEKGWLGYSPIFWVGVAGIVAGMALIGFYFFVPAVAHILVSWQNGAYLALAGVAVCMVSQFLEDYGTESMLLIAGWAVCYFVYFKGLKTETPEPLKKSKKLFN